MIIPMIQTYRILMRSTQNRLQEKYDRNILLTDNHINETFYVFQSYHLLHFECFLVVQEES